MGLQCERVRRLAAGTGQKGIAWARKAEPDLVLLDMHLPDLTGFDGLAALREEPRTAELRGAAVSGNLLPVDRASACRSVHENQPAVAGSSVCRTVPSAPGAQAPRPLAPVQRSARGMALPVST